jgi:hypothetical protein
MNSRRYWLVHLSVLVNYRCTEWQMRYSSANRHSNKCIMSSTSTSINLFGWDRDFLKHLYDTRFFLSYNSWLAVSHTTIPESMSGPKSSELLTYLVVWHALRVLSYFLISGTCPKPMIFHTLSVGGIQEQSVYYKRLASKPSIKETLQFPSQCFGEVRSFTTTTPTHVTVHPVPQRTSLKRPLPVGRTFIR